MRLKSPEDVIKTIRDGPMVVLDIDVLMSQFRMSLLAALIFFPLVLPKPCVRTKQNLNGGPGRVKGGLAALGVGGMGCLVWWPTLVWSVGANLGLFSSMFLGFNQAKAGLRTHAGRAPKERIGDPFF